MDILTGTGYQFNVSRDEFGGGVQVQGDDGNTVTTLFYLTAEDAISLGLALVRTATDN